MTRFLLAFVASAIEQAALAQPGQARRFDGKLSPCEVEGVAEVLRCGRFGTFENRAGRTGRRINLKVVVIPATSPDVARDAVVYLAGGGVLPATEYAGFFVRQFAQLRRHRDILLVDQRGTGESNPLPCAPPTPMPGVPPEDAYLESITRCRADLQTVADLRFYSTPLAMDDLDDVRAWLGYEQLTLYGMSYGTKAAQVYMRQHPSRVRTVAMHGVVPLNTSMWIDTPRLGQEALDRVITLCAGQPVCASAFPKLRSEIDAVIQRLAS
ncbi:MAG: alpha/beta fold hydrolase, partial [Gemmatimonadaceae bacterium]